MNIGGTEEFAADPSFIRSLESTLAGARRTAREAGEEAGIVFSAAVGSTDSSGVVLPGEKLALRRSYGPVRPLMTWFESHADLELGLVWWWALTFDASSAWLQWSRDEFPPARIRALIEANGLDLDLAHNWVLQRKAFDHRPADRLPEWWVEKLESVGAWDPVKKELAVDEDANPLYGPQLFGGDPDDEFYANDGDDDVQP